MLVEFLAIETLSVTPTRVHPTSLTVTSLPRLRRTEAAIREDEP
jgi:hypothetical protein